MFNKFTNKSQEAIINAQIIAQENGQAQIEALHILASLLDQNEGLVRPVLDHLKLLPASIEEQVYKKIKRLPKTPMMPAPVGTVQGTAETAGVLEQAHAEAEKMGDDYISTEHIFLALISTHSEAQEILLKMGVAYEEVLKILAGLRGNQRVDSPEPEGHFQVLKKYAVNLTEQARKKKLDPVIGREDEIRRIMQVLSRRTKNNPVLIGEAGTGKTAIVEGLAQRMVSGDVPETLKNKELLSLDLGAMVAGAKFRGEFEDRLKAVMKEIKSAEGKLIVFIDELHTIIGVGASEGSMDASNMLKPALARGEFRCIGATTAKEYQKYIERDAALERRFQPIYVNEPSIEDTVAILRGIKERYEVHHGVRISDDALIAAAQLSVRYISDRFLPDKAVDLIDEAASALRMEIDSMPEELDKMKREIKRLEIEKVGLNKDKGANNAKLRTINKQLGQLKEKSAGLELQWQNEKNIISQTSSLKKEIEEAKAKAEIIERRGDDLTQVAEIRYGRIPQLEKEAKRLEAELAAIQTAGRRILKEEIEEEDIARVVSRWTGVPVAKMLESEIHKLVRVEEELNKRVVGQDDAIKAVSSALRRSRAGISEEKKPIGSFLFVGPTGTGKTELAKALSAFMFNDESAMIRLDMSEFMEKHSVAKMIGSPPGYIGHEEGGQLTEKVRRHPYSVILFDEIEKAHPEVFNMLLQILDDGRLTDSKGRAVNFKNTIVIMTSNLGNEIIKDYSIGFSDVGVGDVDQARENEMKEKIDKILREHFKLEFLNRIDETVVFKTLDRKALVKIVDLELSKVSKRLKGKNIKVLIGQKVKKILAEKGFDPTFGARPLKRLIQTMILDELAMKIVEGNVKEGDSVNIDIGNNERVLVKAL